MFSWARGEGLLDGDNPVEGTNSPAPTAARDRVLSDAELANIWKGCGDDAFGCIVKLLILTGARRKEIGDMQERELNRDNHVWKLPADRAKNGEALTLHLSGLAWSIIEKLSRNGGRLFGGFNNWHKAKAALDKRCGVKEWTLHDLRRTAATRMADIGVQPHIIEAVLNHVSGHKAGVAGVYNRSSYQREVKNALAVWADHVASIVRDEERKILQFPAETG